jgi:transposase
VDRALIDHCDRVLNDREWSMRHTATPHEAQPLYLLQPVPGLGTLLHRVRLSERQAIDRFPRGQDGVSSCRFVNCAQASAGTCYGTSGTQMGNADLTGAFSEAAVLC